jgi:hypothetical protein
VWYEFIRRENKPQETIRLGFGCNPPFRMTSALPGLADGIRRIPQKGCSQTRRENRGGFSVEMEQCQGL